MKRLLLASALLIAAPAFAARAPIVAALDTAAKENAGSVTVQVARYGDLAKGTLWSYSTADGTAKAGVNYLARSGTLYFQPGQASASVSIPILDDGAVTADKAFTLNVAIGSGNVGTPLGATITVINTDAAPTPAPAPAPAPSPPAATGDVLSPSLSGLPPVDDGIDLAGLLAPVPLPGSAAPDVVGAFRFICMPGQVLKDDPIVYPGQPGASHAHQFYGNTGANAYSTYASLRTSGDSTCMGPGNRSGYWMPALLNGLGQAVRPDYVSIYYKRRPASDPIVSDPANPQYMGNAVPLPNGLRFIFGFDMLTNTAPTGEAWFNCDGPTAKPGHYLTLDQAFANCPAGNRLGAVIEAPSCWDGKRLDSANHRDHVAYAGYGTWGYLRCPATHPYVIPAFTLGAWYSILAGDDTSKWHLSSDEMRPALPRGATFHADWWGAWKDGVMALWMENCINKMLNCSGGNLGNGQAMKQLSPFSWNANPRLVPSP